MQKRLVLLMLFTLLLLFPAVSCAGVNGFSIEGNVGTAPQEVHVTVETSSNIRGIKVMDENGKAIPVSIVQSQSSNGKIWELAANISSSYDAEWTVYLKSGNGQWTASDVCFFVSVSSRSALPNSNSTASSAGSSKEIAALERSTVNIGDIIYFGRYEQDNHLSNGKEEISWVVMAKNDNRILLMSEYVLDMQPYDINGFTEDWERCSLRKWLNNTFIFEAFNDQERKILNASRDTERGTIFLAGYDDTIFHGLSLGSVFMPDNHNGFKAYLHTGIENYKAAEVTPYVRARYVDEYFSDWHRDWCCWEKDGSVYGSLGFFAGNDTTKAHGVRPFCWVTVTQDGNMASSGIPEKADSTSRSLLNRAVKNIDVYMFPFGGKSNQNGQPVGWAINFQYTPLNGKHLSDAQVSWGKIEESGESFENAKNGLTQISYINALNQEKRFLLLLPDSPEIAGWQTLTFTLNGYKIVYAFHLVYEGNYKTGAGWNIDSWHLVSATAI